MFIVPEELNGWVVTKVGVATDETAPDSDLTVNFYLNGGALLGTPVMGSGDFHAEAVVDPPVAIASFDAITGMYEYTQGSSIPTGLNYLITIEWV